MDTEGGLKFIVYLEQRGAFGMRKLRSESLPCIVIDGVLFTRAQINHQNRDEMILFLQPETNQQKGKIVQLQRNIKRRKQVLVSMEQSYQGRISGIYYPNTTLSVNLSNFNEIENVVVTYCPIN